MLSVTECIQQLQILFGDTAQKIAIETDFIQRERKITALGWLLATVLGWMNNKNGTLETISANFEQQGVKITEQGISKRFTPQAVDFLKQLIAHACMLLICTMARFCLSPVDLTAFSSKIARPFACRAIWLARCPAVAEVVPRKKEPPSRLFAE